MFKISVVAAEASLHENGRQFGGLQRAGCENHAGQTWGQRESAHAAAFRRDAAIRLQGADRLQFCSCRQ